MATPMMSSDRASAERRFFTGIALAILATVVVGFSRSFFLRPLFPDWPSPSETIFYVHGAAFSAWIVLGRANRVAGRRTELHRKIGRTVRAWLLWLYWARWGTRCRPARHWIHTGSHSGCSSSRSHIRRSCSRLSFGWSPSGATRRHKRWMLLATVNLVLRLSRLAGSTCPRPSRSSAC
jgi:hypothetical protein